MLDTALILAGGLGTRLRPLTEKTPKPLLPIKGKPIIQHTIEQLQRHGIKKVILSLGHEATQIKNYFTAHPVPGIDLHYAIETEPLGTGGAVHLAAARLTKPFFLVWGDNLMDVDYQEMYKAYLRDASQVTMALVPREDVEHFGVAVLDGQKITAFVEKPSREEAPSNVINAGAFIIDPECLKILPEGKSSIEKDCFEKLAPLGHLSAYIHQGQWFPTDTLEKYSKACQEFIPEINLRGKKVIIADVDETMCESCQHVSATMAQQIDVLIQRGYQFAFISGTKAEDLQAMISSRLTQEHHLLAATGTKYVKVNGQVPGQQPQQMMYNHSLSSDEKQEIIRVLKKLTLTYNLQSLTTTEDQLQDRDSQMTLSVLGRHAPPEQKAAYDPDGKKRQVLVEFLKQHIDNEKYELTIGGTTSIDITRKGLDKEWGIREFARFNDIPLSEIIFIGDKLYPGGNDYPAAKIVDCIAVKNPDETLKKLRQL